MIICSPQLGLAPESVLGGEVFDREILLGLAKKGIKIEIILPQGKSYDQNIRNWKLTFIPISHFPAIIYNLLIPPYLYKIYRNRKFEIVRIHQPQFIGLGCLIFKMFYPKIKLVATYHQFKESNFGPFSIKINNFWDHIICDSQFVKGKIIEAYQVPSSKISVLHNGVPPYLKPEPKDKNLTERLRLQGKIVILYMGLFIQRKNPLFLLDILKRLSRTRSNLVLIFWGEGSLRSEILEKAKKLGVIDQIRVQKPVFGEEKNKIHNLADIFIHPSKDEGFALAPLEAMACSKPVVMTKGYSAPEAIEDGVNGFLCHFNNLSDWTQALNKLIESPSLRKQMGESSLLKVKKEFQWKYAVEKNFNVFQRMLK